MGTTATHADAFEYPPPSREISGGWMALLKVFGPGAIIASVTVGTGETIFAPRMGAIFGYTMFWVVMAAVIAKALLVYSGMRHLVLTGEHPMAAWARLPGAARLGARAGRRDRGDLVPALDRGALRRGRQHLHLGDRLRRRAPGGAGRSGARPSSSSRCC